MTNYAVHPMDFVFGFAGICSAGGGIGGRFCTKVLNV